MRILLFLSISLILFSCKQERASRMAVIAEKDGEITVDGPCVLINPYLVADMNGIALSEDSLRQIEDFVKGMNVAFAKDSLRFAVLNAKQVTFTDYYKEFEPKVFSFKDTKASLAIYFPGKEVFTSEQWNIKNEIDYEVQLAMGRDVSSQYYQELKIQKDIKRDSVMEERNTNEKKRMMDEQEKQNQIQNSDTTKTNSNGLLSPVK